MLLTDCEFMTLFARLLDRSDFRIQNSKVHHTKFTFVYYYIYQNDFLVKFFLVLSFKVEKCTPDLLVFL
jgi:hypothetical protein